MMALSRVAHLLSLPVKYRGQVLPFDTALGIKRQDLTRYF
jgi:hypothetical protein